MKLYMIKECVHLLHIIFFIAPSNSAKIRTHAHTYTHAHIHMCTHTDLQYSQPLEINYLIDYD